MWSDTTPALRAVARQYFADRPGTETMLGTTDGNLFADNTVGEGHARAHAASANTTIVRVTRAGGVVPFTPTKGQPQRGGGDIGGHARHY